MKKLTLLIIILIGTSLYAQDVFLETGMNFTSYDYKNANGGTTDNIKSGNGLFLRAGLGSIGFRSKFSYGTSLNKFNATGGNGFDKYDWDVTHFGVFSQWTNYLGSEDSFSFNFAFDLSSMIDGKQTLGSQTIKLSEYDEFKGIWGGPRAGLSYQVISTNNTFLEIGYSFQLSLHLSGGSDESLSFTTHQIGIKLNLQ